MQKLENTVSGSGQREQTTKITELKCMYMLYVYIGCGVGWGGRLGRGGEIKKRPKSDKTLFLKGTEISSFM